MLELLWGFVYNCALMVVGIVVASIILPHVAGKAMIRGMAKAASEVFDDDVRAVVASKLGEAMGDPNVKEVLYQIMVKLITDKDIVKMVMGGDRRT